jgi:hypothetical protein
MATSYCAFNNHLSLQVLQSILTESLNNQLKIQGGVLQDHSDGSHRQPEIAEEFCFLKKLRENHKKKKELEWRCERCLILTECCNI